MAVRQGLRFLRAELPRILATPPDVLSARMVRVIRDLAEDWRRLDERIDYLSSEIAVLGSAGGGAPAIGRFDPLARRRRRPPERSPRGPAVGP